MARTCFRADHQPVFVERPRFIRASCSGRSSFDGAGQDFEGDDDTGDVGDLAEVGQALRFEGGSWRAGGSSVPGDRRRQFLVARPSV